MKHPNGDPGFRALANESNDSLFLSILLISHLIPSFSSFSFSISLSLSFFLFLFPLYISFFYLIPPLPFFNLCLVHPVLLLSSLLIFCLPLLSPEKFASAALFRMNDCMHLSINTIKKTSFALTLNYTSCCDVSLRNRKLYAAVRPGSGVWRVFRYDID